MMKVLIINGPNLNLLGVREPGIYGSRSMEHALKELRDSFADRAEIDYFQSNHEGDIIDAIHKSRLNASAEGIILNAGAYTHTSLAIADAIAGVKPLPVIEVHLSNVHAREQIRHTSLISPVCRGVIAGFGLDSYRLALEALLHQNN